MSSYSGAVKGSADSVAIAVWRERRYVVREIMSGTVSPDEDFRSHWLRAIPLAARRVASLVWLQ
jgi:hypothetical protein